MKTVTFYTVASLALCSASAQAQTNTCAPTPERLIVLGDSIAACYGVGGIDSADCGPYQYHRWLDENISRGISYENLAQNGDRTVHVADEQLDTIPVGPGHALITIYIGGNDLQTLLYIPDDAAEMAYPALKESLEGYWSEIFDFVQDPANFPDGATLIINNQYNPFDDCYGTSETKIALLADYNQMMSDLTANISDAYTADPYSVFLGHGHNYQRRSCPYYDNRASYWMGDLIHPNAEGHGMLGEIWANFSAPLYQDCR